eukprot:m.232841 g.232841  ORF g.232841 m.232841 type:complete len:450 (-) comp17374_c0_seq33:2290-3639(-)
MAWISFAVVLHAVLSVKLVSGELTPELAAFESWMADQGLTKHGSVSIRHEAISGYGLYADTTIASGTIIATIPLTAVVNVEHAMVDEATGPLWQALDDLSDLDIFTGWMAFQLAHPDHESMWSPYFQSLPLTTMTSPLLLTKQQLAHYKLSAVVDMINQRNFSMAAAFDEITMTAASGTGLVADWFGTTMTWEDYVIANTMIRSRSYRVGIKDTLNEWQDAMCLVPLADLLNTDFDESKLNIKCKTDKMGAGLQANFLCKTTRTVSKDEQLLAQYSSRAGSRISSKLALDYAFVPESNPQDAMVIELPPADKALDKLLKAFNLHRGSSALPMITQPSQVQDMQVVVYFTLLQLFKKDRSIAQQRLQAVQVAMEDQTVRLAAMEEFFKFLLELQTTRHKHAQLPLLESHNPRQQLALGLMDKLMKREGELVDRAVFNTQTLLEVMRKNAL